MPLTAFKNCPLVNIVVDLLFVFHHCSSKLALEAAGRGVSMNHQVSAKLAYVTISGRLTSKNNWYATNRNR